MPIVVEDGGPTREQMQAAYLQCVRHCGKHTAQAILARFSVDDINPDIDGVPRAQWPELLRALDRAGGGDNSASLDSARIFAKWNSCRRAPRPEGS